MALPSSGELSLSEIKAEFGGGSNTPTTLSNYYRVADLNADDRMPGEVPSLETITVLDVAEEQQIRSAGARSNYIQAIDSEKVLLALPDDFNSGTTDPDITVILSDIATINNDVSLAGPGGFYSFSATTFATRYAAYTADDWTALESIEFVANYYFTSATDSTSSIDPDSSPTRIDLPSVASVLELHQALVTVGRVRVDFVEISFSNATADSVDIRVDNRSTTRYIGFNYAGTNLYDALEFEENTSSTDIAITVSTDDTITYNVGRIPASYSFLPDATGQTYNTGTTVSFEVDCTNASLSGTAFQYFLGDIENSNYTNWFGIEGFSAGSSPETIAAGFEGEFNQNPRDGITVTRNGAVVTVSSTDVLEFWINGGGSLTDRAFFFAANWVVPPVIRVTAPEIRPPIIPGDPPIILGRLEVNNEIFDDNIGNTAALTNMATSIAAIHTDFTWDGTTPNYVIPDTPSQITLDYTNATISPFNSYSEYFFGNWRTGWIDHTASTGEVASVNINAGQIPIASMTIVDEIQTEMNSRLAGGFTLTRANNVLTLTASSGNVTLRVNTSSSSGGTTFGFDPGLSQAPVIRVTAPIPGTPVIDGDTEISGTSIEIDYSAVTCTGSYSEYFFGNWHTSSPSGEQASVSGSLSTAQVVDEIELEMNSVLNDGFTLTRDGLILTLSSEGRLVFAVNDNSNISNTFGFDESWSIDPVITPVLPVAGINSVEGSPEIDIGTDAFTGKSVTVDFVVEDNLTTILTATPGSSTNFDLREIVTNGFAGDNTPQSMYSIFDYNNSQFTNISSSVGSQTADDRASVMGQIATAINTNTENPTNFGATFALVDDDYVLTILAEETGPVTGLWSITANHGGGDGTLAFFPAVETVEGTDASVTIEPINQNIPTSGEISFSDFYDATNGDSS